jgi:hypothetical protein
MHPSRYHDTLAKIQLLDLEQSREKESSFHMIQFGKNTLVRRPRAGIRVLGGYNASKTSILHDVLHDSS